MNRRQFLTAIGAASGATLAGCINTTQEYGLDEDVPVEEGTLRLIDTRATKLLFTQPVDTPATLLGQDDAQYIIFEFDTSDLDIENGRTHDYLTDALQYRLSPDTVAPLINTPLRRETDDETTTSVAFRVTSPFSTDDTTLRWTTDTEPVWPATRVIDETTTAYLGDPPRFTVDDVSIPERTSDNTATVRLTVTNTGNRVGQFKAIVRSDEATYIDQPVEPNETVDITADIQVTSDEQPVLVSWGLDQQTATINRE